MKTILVDDHGKERTLTDKQTRSMILNNNIQELFHVSNDKYLLYKSDRYHRRPSGCPIYSRIISQRDARKNLTK